MDKHFYISELIAKKNKGILSEKEEKELQDWASEKEENEKIIERATDSKNLINKLEVYQLFKKNDIRASLERELFDTKTVHFNPKTFLRYAAILVPMIMLAGISWYFLNTSASRDFAQLDETIIPGSQKATLVLSDGDVIDLEDKSITTEMKQGNTRINNQQNSLTYSEDVPDEQHQPLVYNELITPNGGNYRLVLADGTEVILNAGSSLKYPVSFSDSVRKVYLKGQAYFDVSHNGKPFIVSSNEMDVRVLGTSFDVSAYTDDSYTKTTLVEGKVMVTLNQGSGATNENILKPNDQAILNKSQSKFEIIEVNTSQYTSWTQGKIEFSHANLEMVMRRLARWYDFKYKFENESAKDYHFTARLDNDQSISSILEMLEMTTDVKFNIRDNTIVIL